MKNLKLVILLLLSPLTFFAQQLTGLWMGALSNDSTSIRQDQSFEIALTEYRGKVYGYSRSTFIVNDTLYYIVKRVKGNIENGVCEVKDDEIVSCNFPKRIEKGVKVIHTFRMNQTDSTWQLDGNWKTTQTKKYYSVSGKSDLSEEKDIDNSKIFPHLEELNLAKEVPFYVTARKAKDEAVTQQLAAEKRARTGIRTEQQTGVSKPDLAVNKPVTAIKTATVAINNEVVTPDERVPQTSITPEQQSAINKPDVAGKPSSVKTTIIPVNTEVVTPDERAAQTTISPEQQSAINKPDVAGKRSSVKTTIIPVNNEVVTPDERALQTTVSAEQQSTLNKTGLAAGKPVATSVKTATVPVNNNITVVQEKKPIVTAPPVKQPVADKPAVAVNKPVTTTPVKNTSPVTSNNTVVKTEEKKPQPVTRTEEAVVKNTIANTETPPVSVPASDIIAKNTVDNPAGAASLYKERKTDAQQTVLFRADSLTIAVYDNGEIDGDTVSVLLNGQVVLAKQGLKASASKKTLYLPSGNDEEFSLVLYAENLGKYPPNTGLLVIYDGEERHYVRFSADLQKNAGVVLKRKK